ncbi:MAG TPA: hypothetical protein VLH08_03640, partial [Acidobacteriota bacterium]|nr:hypothetical protein [Acidobacteriota bacterium]
VDFHALEKEYGSEFLERIYFHILAFTANTLVSLRPATFDPGPYKKFCTSEFWSLWKSVIRGAWAQWRYEHDLPDYYGPDLEGEPIENQSPIKLQSGNVPILNFCGGGKDSLVSLGLLQRAAIPFDTLVYSSSVYGSATFQHQLSDSLLDAANVRKDSRRRIWCYDDVNDSPLLHLHPEFGARTLTAAETPASVFLALPLSLQHGYTYLCVSHERSADTGNLVWKRTGEEVNHQWGKSIEAEILLNQYLRTNLIENCEYFSILKPIYDVLIFNLMLQDLDAARYTHSCNIKKPWCGRCPKCAYVWINYMAYLPVDLTQEIFRGLGNLLDVPENQITFRQMLGLEEHTPFECIGQVDEVKLAFELCKRKGLSGAAMQLFEREVAPVDIDLLLEKYLQVIEKNRTLPNILRNAVLQQLRDAATKTRKVMRDSSR